MACARSLRLALIFGIISSIGLAGGCGPAESLDRVGVSLPDRDGWKPIDSARSAVPGTPILAWSGPGGAEMVLFRSLPIPGDYPETAKALAIETSNRWINLPGLEVKRSETTECDGHPAAIVEAVAPGTGTSIAPSGTGKPLLPGTDELVATRRVLVSIPLPAQTLNLQWHCPEAAADSVRPEIDAIAQSLQIKDVRPATQSY